MCQRKQRLCSRQWTASAARLLLVWDAFPNYLFYIRHCAFRDVLQRLESEQTLRDCHGSLTWRGSCAQENPTRRLLQDGNFTGALCAFH